jgi:polyisoprenoid-binding protein YceI
MRQKGLPMSRNYLVSLIVGVVALIGTARSADHFEVDPVHSSVTFMIEHMGISYIHGRFNEVSGSFDFDKDAPEKSSFTMTIKSDSVDTNVKGRDTHLRSPDFFNTKQFPLITFQSTQVKKAKDGYDVTGDFTMHGVKKPLTISLKGGKQVDFKGMAKTGFFSQVSVNRADFEVGSKIGPEMLGNTVYIYIGMEGAKK